MKERIGALKAERDAVPAEFERIKQIYVVELEQHRVRLQARIDELNGRIAALEELESAL